MPGQVQQQPLFNVHSWTPGELEIFRKREPLKVSEWAERNIVVKLSARPGPWRNSVTPYLTEIMDTWGEPHVREVVVCASTQIGKTSVMYNCMGYAIDRAPGPSLLVMPDQESTRRIGMDRIKPMIELSPVLKNLLTSNPDDFAKTRIRFTNGMRAYISWSTSPALLASLPIQYLFFDEVDKYPQFSGDEADPISLGEERTGTYQYTKKIFKVSTPTKENKFIWLALNESQEIRDYYVPCHACGTFQKMVFENIVWPEKVNGKRIKQKYLARYKCENKKCKAKWTDSDRDVSVKAGHWRPREKQERPQSVGFHLPVYYSPFVSLSEVVEKFLEAEKQAKIGNPAKRMNFFNSKRAEPYIPEQAERKEDTILALRDDRPRGLVPADISCLTAAVDTQKTGFYYEIRAWGWGMNLESWGIRDGYVETFEGLSKILFDSDYKNANGENHIVSLAMIDSGGTMSDYGETRTAQVYDYCRMNKRVFPLKGQRTMNMPHRITKLDSYPGTNKPIRGGLNLYRINVTYYKNFLANKLEIAPADPGAWHLHSKATEAYAKQMCAEFRNDKGFWECPRGKPNHFWDVSVYQLASAEILGIKFWKQKTEESQKQKRVKKQPETRRRW